MKLRFHATIYASISIAITACSVVPTPPQPPQQDTSPPKPAYVVDGAGYYQVRKGDTLRAIALGVGQDPHDIIAWNGLANADVLSIGQMLRVVPPTNATPDKTAAASAKRDAVTNPAKAPAPDPFANLAILGRGPNQADADAAKGASQKPIVWARPTQNKVLSPYLEGVNRGVDFDGEVGDAIVAAAAGKVTLVSNALRGYGNLVVIKHNANCISVYTHASKILVHEGDHVAKAQKIAEIGRSDSDRPKLHFEIRIDGKPVDPAKYLPPR